MAPTPRPHRSNAVPLALSPAAIAVASVAFLVRAAVGRHGYSGRATPPLFGDLEAQRHWLEITWHLPPSQWYHYDQKFWGLDYPPLTAFFSYVFGAIAHFIDPSWVALDKSRGNEDPALIAYMRLSVLICDLLVYFPAALLFVRSLRLASRSARVRTSTLHPVFARYRSWTASLSWVTAWALILSFPGLILIDHGHFQYNLIMLGLTLASVAWMTTGHPLKAAVVFSLALMFKQMALYFALPVFVYLLAQCWRSNHGIRLFVQLGVVVLATFALHLYPFRTDLGQLVHRIFPIARGLYEDKVANVWCALSPVLKLRDRFELTTLLRMSLATTIFASLPSLIGLFRHPTRSTLLASLAAVSLAFFLFSFQVHEKSILLPDLPILLLLVVDRVAENPRWSVWAHVLNVSTFSMWPLLRRDGQAVPYFVLLALWNGGVWWTAGAAKTSTGGVVATLYRLAVAAVYVAAAAIHVAEFTIAPPARYPHLYVLANQVLSCGVFLFAYAATTALALSAPTESIKSKVKRS
ncbi:Glucosyltransferase-like protein [Allomyces javanicus]|nr:Glucosyltransferase-like protein [Allomyces javanicus]